MHLAHALYTRMQMALKLMECIQQARAPPPERIYAQHIHTLMHAADALPLELHFALDFEQAAGLDLLHHHRHVLV